MKKVGTRCGERKRDETRKKKGMDVTDEKIVEK